MQATSVPKRGIEFFFITLVVLAIIRVILQTYSDFPIWLAPIANVVMGCVFLGGPLLALCFAAKDKWTWKMGAEFFFGGLALQIFCFLLNRYGVINVELPKQVINALGQIGLPIWCVGLGAMLAMLIRDRNIVVPIAIFLGFLDMFLVLTPSGPTAKIMKMMPALLPQVAVQIPTVHHEVTSMKVTAGALAGPADFLFLAMFLVALFRHNMRARHTVLVVIPTLLVYMLIVYTLRFSLPALVPIGAVVLIVNWREFELTKDEKISTVVVAAVGAILLTWGMLQKPKEEQAGSSPKASVPLDLKSPNLPAPNDTNQSE